jgi:hypothetical protein
MKELDTGTELDATECAEVTSAELGSGTDLGIGRGRWMERSRDGSARVRSRGTGRGRCGQNPSCDRERGYIAQSSTSDTDE